MAEPKSTVMLTEEDNKRILETDANLPLPSPSANMEQQLGKMIKDMATVLDKSRLQPRNNKKTAGLFSPLSHISMKCETCEMLMKAKKKEIGIVDIPYLDTDMIMPLVNNLPPLVDTKKNLLTNSGSIEENKPPSRQPTPAKTAVPTKAGSKVRSPFEILDLKTRPLIIKQTVIGCLLAVVRSGGMCLFMFIV